MKKKFSPRPSLYFVTEYLVISDKDSKVLKTPSNWYEAVKLAKLIRRGGGEVSVFKSTKG